MRKIRHFIMQEKGGLVVMLALLLPFIISCFALAFDGARLMTKNARLGDAIHEAGLIVATISSSTPDEAEKAELRIAVRSFIAAHMPAETIKNPYPLINVSYITDEETGTLLPVFDIRANIDVKTLLPITIAPAFAPTLEMANRGKVRKGLQLRGEAADYVFVLDFSNSVNLRSAQPGMTRIELLKKVVKDITEAAIEAYPDTTFALVPFDIGVMVRNHNFRHPINNTAYPDKNKFGGDIPGCAIMMIPRPSYNINYAFWSNKSLLLRNLPNNYTHDDVMRVLQFGRYEYFRLVVMPTVRRLHNMSADQAWQQLITQGLCRNNPEYTDADASTARYLCERTPEDPTWMMSEDITHPDNQAIITEEVDRVIRYVFRNSAGLYIPTANHHSMDVNATLNGMFDENNMIVFPRNYASWHAATNHPFNPFSHMCLSSGHDYAIYHGGNANRLDMAKTDTYLIEPTNDLAVLEEFQYMGARGGTDSSSGLLVAVPQMLKGSNPRKALIVISDGDDNPDARPTRDALHRRAIGDRVCDRIRTGVKERTGATDVDIYFISVVDDIAEPGSTARTKYWADHCTGPENAVIATSYDSIMGKLVDIMNKYEETGYFYH